MSYTCFKRINRCDEVYYRHAKIGDGWRVAKKDDINTGAGSFCDDNNNCHNLDEISEIGFDENGDLSVLYVFDKQKSDEDGNFDKHAITVSNANDISQIKQYFQDNKCPKE